MNMGFRWNFAAGTSKEINYMNSPYIKSFLFTALKSIKIKEGASIQEFSPRKKDEANKYPKEMRGNNR